MRAYLVALPMWVMSAVSGVLFGAVMTVYSIVRDDDLPLAFLVGMGVLVGIAFGISIQLVLGRDFDQGRAELAALPIEQRRAAIRAVSRGPAPADPTVRKAALNQVLRTRDLYRRRARFNLTVFGAFLVLEVVLAIRNPWYWAAVALFAGFFVAQLVLPRRLERRAAVLSSPAQAGGPGSAAG